MADVIGRMEAMAWKRACSIAFLHHTNKSSAMNAQGEMQQASRGSSVLVDNIRWQMYLAGCTKEEAKSFDIDETRRGYFVRTGVSKQNYGPPVAEVWMRRTDGGVLIPAEFSTSYTTAKKLEKEVW
jgi:RecA-family ATPase